MSSLEQIARKPVFASQEKMVQFIAQRDEREKNTHGNSSR